MKLITGKTARPRRVLCFGQNGVGKDTFAAGAPQPIFIDIEGGLNDINCVRNEHPYKHSGEVEEALMWLLKEPHRFATLVVSTMDWLEKLVIDKLCSDLKVATITDAKFGKGYNELEKRMRKYLDCFERLRSSRNMNIVLVAHAKVQRIEPPDGASYDRHEPALQERVSRLVQDWCDEVLFARFKIFTRTEEESFGRKRRIATDTGERILITSEAGSVCAKNRLHMPAEIPLKWREYASYWPGVTAPASGEVNESEEVVVGSSV